MHAWENQDENILVFTCKPPPPVEPPVWPAGQKLETEEETEEFLNQPCTSRSPLTTPPHDCNQASPPSSPPAIQLDQPLTTPPPNCEQSTHLSSPPPAIPPDRLLHSRRATPFYHPPAIQLPLRRATHYHPYLSSPSPLPTQYRSRLSSHNLASSSSHSIGSTGALCTTLQRQASNITPMRTAR